MEVILGKEFDLGFPKTNSGVRVFHCFIRMTKGQSFRRSDTKWTSTQPVVSSVLFINCSHDEKNILLHFQIKQGGMNCISV